MICLCPLLETGKDMAAMSRRGAITRAKLVSSSFVAVACIILFSITTPTSAVSVVRQADLSPHWPSKRHGDEEHGRFSSQEESTVEGAEHSMAMQHHPNVSEDMKYAAAAVQVDHEHLHQASHPYDRIPSPKQLGLEMIVVPPLPHGAGGHSHGHAGAPVLTELNETTVLRAKGPDPLSYIEWDFAYGLAGRHNDLSRFVKAYPSVHDVPWDNLMGISGGRYRTLVDELEMENRKSVVEDLQARLHADLKDPGRHRLLMVLHVVGSIFSCFILLPAALALRAASSSLAPLATLVYFVTLVGSMLCSSLYKATTPRLYPTNKHAGLGYAVFWISILVLGGDVLRLLKQVYQTLVRNRTKSQKLDLAQVLTGNTRRRSTSLDYDPMEEERMLSNDISGSVAQGVRVSSDPIAPFRQNSTASSSGSHSPPRSVHFEEDGDLNRHRPSMWQTGNVSPSSTLLNTPRTSSVGELPSLSWNMHFAKHAVMSQSSEYTERHGENCRPLPQRRFRFHALRQTLRYVQVTVARSIPIISFAAAYTGLAVYTGSCRGPYQNTCMAHGIKGGIFFWYGLLSFGRYLGAYADLGWAWNKQPSSSKRSGMAIRYTAEWVECLVIFIYGATNTWMERFGAAPGDPYTVKQVQHISIAIMFWFAGLMGMILETDVIKRLLALPVTLRQARLGRSGIGVSQTPVDDIVKGHAAPPSYSFSFNPFPALVIGVTGVAMAAHHQDYEYEVSVHSLWGNLLAGFSVLRMLTYFFLWLRPPTNSVMPSRPPTEALASFSLTCGGLVFMLSSEEVSFVAMRNGFGDVMMIMNVTVAIVSLLFCLVAGMMALKAWAVRREHVRAINAHTEAHHHSDIAQSPSFVVGEDDDVEDEEQNIQDEKRQRMTSSPECV